MGTSLLAVTLLLQVTTAVGDGGREVFFSWVAVPGATGYQLEIARDPGFVDVLLRETVAAPGYRWRAPDEHDYFWRVRAIDADKRPGLWSEVKQGRTVPAPALAPLQPRSPADGARVLYEIDGQKVELSIVGAGEAVAAVIEVARDEAFASLVATLPTASNRVELRLPGVGTFFWRVARRDASGAAVLPSPPRRLVVGLGAPRLLAPPAGVTVSSAGPVQLSWAPIKPAAQWQVELSGGSTTDRVEVTAAELPWPAERVGAWTWRVRALDARGAAGPWSAASSLRVLPAHLTLVSPRGGEVLGQQPGSSGVQLAWEALPFPARYEIEIFAEPRSTAPRLRQTTTESAQLIIGLEPGHYGWRVVATEIGAGLQVSSAVAEFTLTQLGSPSDVEPTPAPPPVAEAARQWVAAGLGLYSNLGTLWAATLRLEAAWALEIAGIDLLLAGRLGYSQNQSYYRVEATSLRLRQLARTLPITLALAYRYPLGPVELVGGGGPVLQIAYLAVGAASQWAVRPGVEGFVSAALPLGPGAITFELNGYLNGTNGELLALPLGGMGLTAGYRVSW
jgi:hypothetical protein